VGRYQWPMNKGPTITGQKDLFPIN